MSTVDKQVASRDARTLLWMSADDLARLREATLLVIGAGGTGSLLAVSAAYVGFRKIVICDADELELSNLNRLVYAAPGDIGEPKAELVERYVGSHVPEASVTVIREAFPSVAIIRTLADASTIVAGCVDDTRVRIELDVACRRFGRTLVDLGAGFVRQDGRAVSSGGQVLISKPDGACLMCLGFTRLFNENDYMIGPDYSPQPSLLLLNTVVATMATECLIREATGEPVEFNAVDYSRNDMQLWTSVLPVQPDCRICGEGAERYIASTMPDMIGGEL